MNAARDNDAGNVEQGRRPGLSAPVLFSLRALLSLLDILFIASVLIAPAAWLMTPLLLKIGPAQLRVSWGLKPLIAPFVLLACRMLLKKGMLKLGICSRNYFWDRMLCRKLVLALATTFLAFVAVEQLLERIGYETNMPPIVIKGENNEVHGKYGMVPDPELAWKFSPGGEFKGWKINKLGYRDREVSQVKVPGAIRVICYGDSCSADGGPPYSGCLHQLLHNRPPTDRRWEAFNMAVYGYSSVQGFKAFQLKGKALAPDIVTLYFGWNDHWICGYRPDSNNLAFTMTKSRAALMKILQNKRFGQMIISGLTAGRNVAITKTDGELPADIEERYRVPPDEYRYTLTRFVNEIREINAIPILITAPRGPKLTHHLINNGQGKSLEQLDKAHAEYIQITREVAQQSGTELLDLAADFDSPEFYPLFNKDGIHLTQDGLWRIGEALYDKIRQVTQSPAWQKKVEPE